MLNHFDILERYDIEPLEFFFGWFGLVCSIVAAFVQYERLSIIVTFALYGFISILQIVGVLKQQLKIRHYSNLLTTIISIIIGMYYLNDSKMIGFAVSIYIALITMYCSIRTSKEIILQQLIRND